MKNLILLLLLSFIICSKPKCKGNEYYDETEKKCVQACEETEYFNEETNTCELCPKGEYLDETNYQCVPICSEFQIYNPNTDKCDEYPECKNDEFYNIDSGKCEKSDKNHCSENEIWDDLKKIVFQKVNVEKMKNGILNKINVLKLKK